MSDMHLSDVNTLRERARQHVENGAVTEGYNADREEIPVSYTHLTLPTSDLV